MFRRIDFGKSGQRSGQQGGVGATYPSERTHPPADTLPHDAHSKRASAGATCHVSAVYLKHSVQRTTPASGGQRGAAATVHVASHVASHVAADADADVPRGGPRSTQTG